MTKTLVDTTEEFWEIIAVNYGREAVHTAKEN